MARLDLLRHGETVASGRYHGSTEVELSRAGHAQMASALDGRCYTRVLSSPLRRCRAFAEAYAAAHGLPLAIDARLAELHFGDWEGRALLELQATQPEALAAFWRDPLAHPPPRGETLGALQARVFAALAELDAGTAAAERVLVLTHGGPMRVLIAARGGLALRALSGIDVPHAACLTTDSGESCAQLRARIAAAP